MESAWIAAAVMASGVVWCLLAARNARWARTGAGILLFAGIALALPCVLAGAHRNPAVFFQLPILILGAAGAVHSFGYLRGHGEERSGIYWGCFCLTVAAMFAVTLAVTPLLFLVMWEVMGLASFALTAFDWRELRTGRAAWIYLLACQAGAMALMMMFFCVGGPVWIFVLAVIGFGLKIGFPLLHVWLPEAHPAAPSPVSALMSGAMIQLGFFGILTWGVVPEAGLDAVYGYVLLGLGLTGSFGGMLFALPQKNLKRMLAYSSIENMGIIALGLGLGFLGRAFGENAVVFCGFGGAVLHMLNHALLKGGLFLLAGSVQRAAGTLDMDRMGGLLRRMPKTGTLFLLNAAGISGLPPFNAFVSEFLIYCAGLYALAAGKGGIFCAAGIATVVTLALTGGLAAAVFAKACGAVFLGLPRTAEAGGAGERGAAMTVPVAVLFLFSLLMPFAAPEILRYVLAVPAAGGELAASGALLRVAAIGFGGMLLFAVLVIFRFKLLPRGGENRRSGTWDCGYGAPDERMEYTGTAFSQPLVDFFRPILRSGGGRGCPPEKLYPEDFSYREEEPEDPVLRGFWNRVFGFCAHLAERVHGLQSGYLHLYILIMTAALIAMLIWGLILPWSGTLLKGDF